MIAINSQNILLQSHPRWPIYSVHSNCHTNLNPNYQFLLGSISNFPLLYQLSCICYPFSCYKETNLLKALCGLKNELFQHCLPSSNLILWISSFLLFCFVWGHIWVTTNRDQDILCSAGDRTRVNCVQGKCPNFFPTPPAPRFQAFLSFVPNLSS